MTHRAYSNPKPRAVIGSPWFVRKAVYLIVGLVGLVAVAFGIVSPEQADSWLAQAGSLAAVLGGFLAGVNTGPASDESPAAEIARTVGAGGGLPDGFTAYPQEVNRAD